MSENPQTEKKDFYNEIKNILQIARDNVYKQVNFIMVESYWKIGRKIVEGEQNSNTRAKYGEHLIEDLSSKLTHEFGKGFSERNLRNMRQFYNCFPIRQTVSAKLSWSHYIVLLKIEDENTRFWYMEESIKLNWSVRALEQQIKENAYERFMVSKEQDKLEHELDENTKDLKQTVKDIIKDDYVLEFLDL